MQYLPIPDNHPEHIGNDARGVSLAMRVSMDNSGLLPEGCMWIKWGNSEQLLICDN